MKLRKALELRKAKYIKRWKGRDGKWRYEYNEGKNTGGIESARQSRIRREFKKQQKKANEKKELSKEERVVVLYESPHRILKTLKEIKETFGDRYVVIVREITKLYEEIIRGTTSELIERLEENPIKGEIVLLIKEEAKEKKRVKVNKYARD